MELLIDGYILQDIEDKQDVVNTILDHISYEYIEPSSISRAMEVLKDGKTCGYFLTCCLYGIKSFHGFKFVKWQIRTQMKMARWYIDIENLKYSCYKTPEAAAILHRLGFKDIRKVNDITVTQRG